MANFVRTMQDDGVALLKNTIASRVAPSRATTDGLTVWELPSRYKSAASSMEFNRVCTEIHALTKALAGGANATAAAA